MSRTIRVLGLTVASAMFVVAAAAAQAATGSQPARPAASMKSSKATGAHSIKGTLAKFDPAGRMLTVQTSKGTETLALDANAHIMQGSQMVAAADLAQHTGSRVEVKYTESNGQKTAQDVRLTGSRSARVKPMKKHGR